MSSVVAALLRAAGPWPDARSRAAAAGAIATFARATPELPRTGERGQIARAVEARLAELSARIETQLRVIFAAPELRRLEASWRGLEYLVSRAAPSGGAVRVQAMAVTADELLRDAQRARTYPEQFGFRALHEQAFGTLGGTPFGAVVLDHAFDASGRSIELLDKLGASLSPAGTVLLTGAAPGMFQAAGFVELRERRDLALVFESTEYAKWRALRHSSGRLSSAAPLFLCAPRVLLRAPARTGDAPDAPTLDDGAWGNAAYAVAGALIDDYAATGWFYPLAADTPRIPDGLPERRTEDEFENTTFTPIEVVLSARHRAQLAEAGFTVLAPPADDTERVTAQALSALKPRLVLDDRAMTVALPHALPPRALRRVIAIGRLRQLVGRILLTHTFDTVDEVQRYLDGWIAPHVAATPHDDAPFLSVRLTVGRPPMTWWYFHGVKNGLVSVGGFDVLVEAEVRDPAAASTSTPSTASTRGPGRRS